MPTPPTDQALPAAGSPQRIVSLDLCTDWILARHADATQVAALSPVNPPYQPKGLQRDWPRHDGTLERIIELKPDLIITGEYNAITLRNRLKTLGFRVEILPLPTSLDDIRTYERLALSLLNKPAGRAHPGAVLRHPPAANGAEKTNVSPKADIEFTNGAHTARATAPLAAKAKIAPAPRLLLLGANGVGTGTNTFEHDVLTQAGWRNYLDAPGYQQLDLERVVTDPPEAILWASTEGNALANAFSAHPALRNAIPPNRWLSTDYWRWQCPGPWTWDLIDDLHRWLE